MFEYVASKAGQKNNAAATLVPVAPFSLLAFFSNSCASANCSLICSQFNLSSPICRTETTSGVAHADDNNTPQATIARKTVLVILFTLINLSHWDMNRLTGAKPSQVNY